MCLRYISEQNRQDPCSRGTYTYYYNSEFLLIFPTKYVLQHFPLIFFTFPRISHPSFPFLLLYTVYCVEKWKEDFHWFLLIFSQLSVLLYLRNSKI